MKEKLEEIRSKGLKKIEEVKKLEDLQEISREITGKKSELTEALKSLSELSGEMKKTIGMQATEIKKLFADKLKEKVVKADLEHPKGWQKREPQTALTSN